MPTQTFAVGSISWSHPSARYCRRSTSTRGARTGAGKVTRCGGRLRHGSASSPRSLTKARPSGRRVDGHDAGRLRIQCARRDLHPAETGALADIEIEALDGVGDRAVDLAFFLVEILEGEVNEARVSARPSGPRT